MEGNNLAQQIMAIQRDPTLTDAEKAKKRQELLSGKWAQPQAQGTTGICIPYFCIAVGSSQVFVLLINLCLARGQQDNGWPPGTTCYV